MIGIRLAILSAISIVLAACSTVSIHQPSLSTLPAGVGGHYKTGKAYTVNGRTYYPLTSAYGYDQTGIASWYGPNFNGGRTADGEWYDMHALSAAHPTLPLPTLVRVTNLENGRQVVVRVNDRGPFVKNRLIDLSYAAAKELGFERNGTTRVRVQALDGIHDHSHHFQTAHRPIVPSPTAAKVETTSPHLPNRINPSNQSGSMYVQLGAFALSSNAKRLSHKLSGDYQDVGVYSIGSGTTRLYKVRIGPFQNVHEIERTVMSLESRGIQDAIVVIQ